MIVIAKEVLWEKKNQLAALDPVEALLGNDLNKIKQKTQKALKRRKKWH